MRDQRCLSDQLLTFTVQGSNTAGSSSVRAELLLRGRLLLRHAVDAPAVLVDSIDVQRNDTTLGKQAAERLDGVCVGFDIAE